MEPAALPIASVRLLLSGNEIVLGRGAHTVGRSAAATICIDDAHTSRRHAAIEVLPDAVVVRDLESRNGVTVNAEPVRGSRPLVEGDLIVIGSKGIVLLRIERGNVAPTIKDPDTSGRRTTETSTIAKIALAQRPVAEEDAVAAATAVLLKLGHSTSRNEGALGAFRILGQAASRAIARGEPERAEAILERPLAEVLSTQRAGIGLPSQLVDLAANNAASLAHATGKRTWIDYVFDLYEVKKMPIPPAVADRIATAIGKVR